MERNNNCYVGLARDRTFHRYYAEVGKTKIISAEEEKELFRRYKENNDIEARDKLIHNCLRSVVKISCQYSDDAEKIKDLISAGNLGIFDALERYDPTRNTRFLSYATYWIKLYIREEFYSADLVSMPRWRQKAIRKVKKVKRHYATCKGRVAEDKEICDETELSPTQLRRLEVEELRFTPLDAALCRMLKHSDTRAIENTAAKETKEILENLMGLLSNKENFVLKAYYGSVFEPWSLRQIGNLIGVSSERVRQIKLDSLKRLHRWIMRSFDDNDEIMCDMLPD